MAEPASKRRRRTDRGAAVAETSYVFEGGLRKVAPYEFEYSAFAKGRWLGRTVLDVFEREFIDMRAEYYRRAIASGLITVNGQRAAPTYTIRNSDVLRHRIFRHEPPVCADPITIVEQTDDMLVVNKPGSIPVHPSGRYRHNTVLYILAKEHGLAELYPVHRLDRLTSGVLLLARTRARTQELAEQMRAQEFVKEYVCRVRGEFPAGDVEVDQPIKTYDFKLGLNVVSPDGKPSRTLFRRLSYNGTTSLVYCRPYTGRTHQIRVHLQWLGFPIPNDPLYCFEAWGPAMGKGGASEAELAAIVGRFRRHHVVHELAAIDAAEPAEPAGAAAATDAGEASAEPTTSGRDIKPSSAITTTAPAKPDRVSAPRLPNLKRDPRPHELCLWLHAHRYQGPGWVHEAPWPAWAQADFAGDAWVRDPDAAREVASVARALDLGEAEEAAEQ